MQEKEQPQPVEGQAENVNLTTIEEDESYYGDALNEVERIDFNFAAEVDGIDDEIALLRQEIKKILAGESDPAILRSIIQATNALERLLRTKYEISKDQRKSIKQAIGTVLRNIAVPMGIAVGTEYIGKKIRG